MPRRSHFSHSVFPGRDFRPRPLGPRPGASPLRGGALLGSRLPFPPRPLRGQECPGRAPSSGHAVSKDQVGGGLGGLPAGTRGSGGAASFKARGETGVRFLLTPDLEGILKRLWKFVALGSPLVSYHPLCPWGVP